MNRDKVREMTMQIVFQMDAFNDFDYQNISIIDESSAALKDKQATETLNAIKNHISDIDAVITNNLDNWKFERIGKTELAILRTAVAEMLYCDSIPASVSINEAVNLSKKYADAKSYSFVNAVLGKIVKDQSIV